MGCTQQPCQQLLRENRDLGNKFGDFLLSPTYIAILRDIQSLLECFHLVQAAVSAQRTPTLSVVLPLYEDLILIVDNMKMFYPGLTKGVDAAVSKLTEYLDRSRQVKIYILSMGK